MRDKNLEVCQKHLNSAIQCFRLGMEGQANEDFAGFLDALGRLFAQYPPQKIVELNGALERIFQAQARKDYLYLADLLEYSELVPESSGQAARKGAYA